MSREHVSFSMGVDTTAVARGLRSAKTLFTGWAKSLTTDFAKSMAGMFAVNKVIQGLDAVKRRIEEIGDLAAGSGVSTNFIQGLQNLGSKNGATNEDINRGLIKLNENLGEVSIGSKVAESAFAKWGITVLNENKTLKTTEEVLADIADKMANTTSGAERTAMAIDLLGKGAGKLVPSLMAGGAAMRQLSESSIFKINTESIRNIKAVMDDITGKKNGAMGVFANVAMGPLNMFGRKWSAIGAAVSGGGIRRILEELAGISANIDEINRKKIDNLIAQAEVDKIEKAFEAVLGLLETSQGNLKGAVRDLNFSKITDEQEKLNFLEKEHKALIDDEIRKEAALANQISKSDKSKEDDINTAELQKQFTDAQIEAVKKLKEIEEQKKRVAEELTKEAKNQTEEAKKRVALGKQIADQDDRLLLARRTASEAKADRGKFTLEELANLNIGRRTSWEQKSNILDARDVMADEAEARLADELGNTDYAAQLRSRADNIRSGITSLTSSERYPFRTMEEGIKEISASIIDLLEREDVGLKFQPRMAK